MTRTPLAPFALALALSIVHFGCGESSPEGADATAATDAGMDTGVDAATSTGTTDTTMAPDQTDASPDLDDTAEPDGVADATTLPDAAPDTVEDVAEPDIPDPPQSAWLRTLTLEHFGDVNVCSTGLVEIGPQLSESRIASPWLEFQPGTYNLWTETFWPECRGPNAGDRDVTLDEGKSYTLLAEIASFYSVTLIEDDLTAPSPGASAVRVIEDLGSPQLELCLEGELVTGLVGTSSGSENIEVAAGEYMVEVRATDGDAPCAGTLAWTFITALEADSVHTWLFVEDNSDQLYVHVCHDSTLGERVDGPCRQREADPAVMQ